MTSFCTPGRIEQGVGYLNRTGEFVKSLGGRKPLVVMDAFLASPLMDLTAKLENILGKAGLDYAFYNDITGEPTWDNVAAGSALANSAQCDCVLALGGGSTIDTAKAIAVRTVNPELAAADIPQQVYLKRRPLIAVPTTAGTGSEATKVCVITDPRTGVKENPSHPQLVPNIAVLDPELMITLPPRLTAFTGMDALTHAIEAYVSNKANELTDLYSYTAISLIGKSLPRVIAEGSNIRERQTMAVASCYAGIAFSNASTNLAHAAGRSLGAYFNVPHGLSVALFLPFVMEFGLPAAENRYAKIAVALGADPYLTPPALAKKAIDIVDRYNDNFGLWRAAKQYIPDISIYRKAILELVPRAMAGNGLLTNLKIPTEQDVALLFEKLAAKLADY